MPTVEYHLQYMVLFRDIKLAINDVYLLVSVFILSRIRYTRKVDAQFIGTQFRVWGMNIASFIDKLDASNGFALNLMTR